MAIGERRRRSPLITILIVIVVLAILAIGAFFLFGGEASVDDGEVDITTPDDLDVDVNN
jgi:flagellar basal body-associated protein FliL